MSEPENFVARWSRLKRENAQEDREPPDARLPDSQHDSAAGRPAALGGNQEATPFDVSRLPAIDSLTPSSDIRAFLQSGVPAELTKAALRKVWTTDPAIRDFIGIAENQWDFTDPTAIPGFGPLKADDDVAKLVAQAMGKLEHATEADAGTAAGTSEEPSICEEPLGLPTTEERSTSAAFDPAMQERHAKVAAAPQHGEPPTKVDPATNRRTHGRALPR